jgi:hypothetical protein
MKKICSLFLFSIFLSSKLKLQFMRKILFYFLGSSILVAGLAFSSCKSHEKCPAYSKTSTNEAPASIRNA